MGILQGKGIWTLYDDIDVAVAIAPVVGAKYILCKVSKHGKYDPEEAAKALASVRKDGSLTPVAWTYPYLDAPAAEAECIQRAFKDGFAAVVIDAEADTMNKFTQADDLAQRVLAMGLDTTKIYLCGDPRLNTKMAYLPYANLAKICRGGFMPMAYGELMPSDKKNAASTVVGNAYAEYEWNKAKLGYTIPLMPVISTYWDNGAKSRMTRAEFQPWCQQVQSRGPSFVSLYRAGVTIAEAWVPFKDLQVSATERIPIPDDDREMVLVQPNGAGYRVVAYPPHTPESGWVNTFTDVCGNLVRTRNTTKAQTMYAIYLPAITKPGRYVIETFVPGQHATTKSAQYFVVFYENGQRKETRVLLNQLNYSDSWVSLGTYEINAKNNDDGRVNLVDVTDDTTTKEIAFTTIRWRPLSEGGVGYDAPIGTLEERASPQIWPGKWIDANPYTTKYSLGYHTGADLNLNFPNFNADKGQPVYAVADGVVTCAHVVTGSWNGLIVIKHDPLPDGKPVYSRYGHVENIAVKVGDVVKRGQQISTVGLFGTPEAGNYHLHFDISRTTILEGRPGHWPAFDLNSVLVNYVDPKKFIQDHRP
ncbi:MAG: peptidoglycan DD-metalloendopeptidase family protein [Anaerolineales bacterium]|nr:peptidoglycan DD-metalloendopeptidase family protein [Anaerolineales bacterium]